MPKCRICQKAVYPMDPQINLDGTILHQTCAKCQDCKCKITLNNFAKNETTDNFILLCKVHYFERFRTGGAYLGSEKYAHKSEKDVKAMAKESVGSPINKAPAPVLEPTSAPVDEETPPGPVPLEVASVEIDAENESVPAQTSAANDNADEAQLGEEATPAEVDTKDAVELDPEPSYPMGAEGEDLAVAKELPLEELEPAVN